MTLISVRRSDFVYEPAAQHFFSSTRHLSVLLFKDSFSTVFGNVRRVHSLISVEFEVADPTPSEPEEHICNCFPGTVLLSKNISHLTLNTGSGFPGAHGICSRDR